MYAPTERKQAGKVLEGWWVEGTGRRRRTIGKGWRRGKKTGKNTEKGGREMLEPHSFSFA